MSRKVYIFIKAELEGSEQRIADYFAWLSLGTKIHTEDKFSVLTADNKKDLIIKIEPLDTLLPIAVPGKEAP